MKCKFLLSFLSYECKISFTYFKMKLKVTFLIAFINKIKQLK